MISIVNLVFLCLSNIVLLTVFVKSDSCALPPDENIVQWIEGFNGSVVTVSLSAEKVSNIYLLHPLS